jgi:hypothetical protein
VQVTADPGTWLADFTGLFDLVPGENGRAEIRDLAGNATAVEWHIPRFTVFPEWDSIESWDWPDGVTVTASVGGRTECSAEAVADYPGWDSWSTSVSMNFPEGCDLVAGDTVTLTDGATTRTHIVQNLAITAVVEEDDTVAGTADPEAQIYVWPHATGQTVLVTADDEGTWLADFADVFDLVPGENGRAEIRDEDGNATAVEWHIPRFTVFPEMDSIESWDWPDGVTVIANVDSKPECSAQAVAGYPGWDSWSTFVSMNFPEGCDVVAGDTVILTDGATTRTHTVRNLAITAVVEEDDIVAGTADAGAQIYVWPHATGETLLATAVSGTWQVDFTGMFDLVPGENGQAEIRDEHGNATAVGWYTYYPPP